MNIVRKVAVGIFLFASGAFFLHHLHHWKARYQKDLCAIRDILKENHPGFYDTQNPEFAEWLRDGYQQALSFADQVKNFPDYLYGLQFFVQGFKDNHLRLTYDTSSLPSEWPGFCIGYQPGYRTGFSEDIQEADEAFVVTFSKNESIPVGAQLILCDGMTPRAWLEKYVCAFVDARNIDASWVTVAPYLSWWRGSSFIPKSTIYTFSCDGCEWQESPEWKKIVPSEYRARTERKNAPTVASIKQAGLEQIWVALPSFHPQTKEEKDALESVIEHLASYAKYDLVIFDVRGNKGGNSYFGTRILKKLYGDACCEGAFKRIRGKRFVEWRASRDNIQYLNGLVEKLRQQSQHQEIAVEFGMIVEAMEKCEKLQQPFYTAASATDDPSIKIPGEPCKGPCAVLITDFACASACLDFIDELYAVTPACQIGLPTNADTMYLECRDVVLPSGFAILHFPIKVFRNRERGSNEPWLPNQYVLDVYNNRALAKVINESCGVTVMDPA